MPGHSHPPRGLTSTALILLVTGFLMAAGNLAFFGNVLKTYPPAPGNALALLSLIVVFGAATAFVFALLCFGRTTKPVLIGILLLSAQAAYFMDSFGIIIDDAMLQNVEQTSLAEARDLINPKLLLYVFMLGIGPAYLVARTPLLWRGWRNEMVARVKLIVLLLVAMIGPVLVSGGFYASFAREHKSLRAFANPVYYFYSAGKYLHGRFTLLADTSLRPIGTDAHTLHGDPHRELVILVVGETARADRFSLNGYPRDTNPLLREAKAISFDNFWACGTSTAVSVPCMFSLDGHAGVGNRENSYRENLLDVLQHSGVSVLWMDNNSDSKGVAARVPYASYRSPDTNPVCDEECRDEGMLAPLQKYIDVHPQGDIFVVLHQMGNHGPAYFKRYPPAFEKFRPACQSNDLNRCQPEEIGNAYDNAILYTDHFLGHVIKLLEHNSATFEAAMFYVSDHGESLGERGTYLHGLPYAIAPEEQLRVPVIMWFSGNYDEVDLPALRRKRSMRFTHDNLFHTVLGFFEVKTSIYRPDLDILNDARIEGRR